MKIHLLFRKIHFLFLTISFLAFFSSCGKENSDPSPDVIAHVKDSTLLIKSIRLTMGGEYVEESYNYDSTNRKILLTPKDPSGQIPEGTLAELSYNDKNLLKNIEYKYGAGYIPEPNEITSIKFFYDEQNVLQKMEFHDVSGKIKSYVFTKKTLPSNKYELSWLEPNGVSEDGSWADTMKMKAVFDDSSSLITSTSSYSYVAVSPDNYTQIISTDSFAYDTKGSVLKVFNNTKDTLRHTDKTITWYEFLSRQTKGDNLYNQRKVLMSGIANIPFGNDFFGGQLGLLSYFPGGIEHFQFSKYPFQTMKAFNSSDNQYVTLNGISEFDSKDRLVKFTGLFEDVVPQVYEITYYK